jgi:hypothetical protein
MNLTDYFEGRLEVSEYFQTGISTPINTIGIHATLPDSTNKTGSIALATFSIGKYYSTIGKTLDPPSGINERHQLIAQILEPITVGEHYRVIRALFNPETPSTLSSITVSSQEKRNRRYLTYLSEFTRSWTLKKSHFASLRKDFVWNQFKTTLHRLLQFKPEHISFNLTDDLSIFFKAVAKENNLYLELFFDEESDESVEAVVNVYKDGKVVLAYGGSIEHTFGRIQELLIKKSKATVPTAIPDAISSTHFATAEF